MKSCFSQTRYSYCVQFTVIFFNVTHLFIIPRVRDIDCEFHLKIKINFYNKK